MADIKITVNTEQFVNFLKEKLEIGDLVELVKTYNVHVSPLEQLEKISEIASLLVEALQEGRISQGFTSDEVVEIGSEALDILLGFSGNAWGIIPVGAALEAADRPIFKLILKLAYEKVLARFGDDRVEAKAKFDKYIKSKIAK